MCQFGIPLCYNINHNNVNIYYCFNSQCNFTFVTDKESQDSKKFLLIFITFLHYYCGLTVALGVSVVSVIGLKMAAIIPDMTSAFNTEEYEKTNG